MSFIMDKIKVQQNLVYDKYTHQLIGYVDLGDPQLNFSTFNDRNALASYTYFFILEKYYKTLTLKTMSVSHIKEELLFFFFVSARMITKYIFGEMIQKKIKH